MIIVKKLQDCGIGWSHLGDEGLDDDSYTLIK